MDIKIEHHLPIAQKPYTLHLTDVQWIKEEWKMLEKSSVMIYSVSPWLGVIVIVLRKVQSGELPDQKVCVIYRALNSLLPLVVESNSKAQCAFLLVPLPEIYEQYTMLQDPKIYSSSDGTSGSQHNVLSDKAQKKSAFTSPIEKLKFKKSLSSWSIHLII